MTYDKLGLPKWALAAVLLFITPIALAQTATAPAAPVAAAAGSPLPELDINSDVTFTLEVKRGDSKIDSDRGSSFQRAHFFGKSEKHYQYVMDYFESSQGLQGRLCQLSVSGSLTDCFTVREKSVGGKPGCSISAYDSSKDFPVAKESYSNSSITRAMTVAGVSSDTAREQLRRTNLGRAGQASSVRFQPINLEYSKSEQVVLGKQASPIDFIRARGAVTCKRLHEVIMPAYEARKTASSKTPQRQAPVQRNTGKSAD